MASRRWAIELGAPLAAVAAVTGVLLLVQFVVWVPNFSMAYLVAVLAIAVTVSSRASIVASVASFLAFDFFFVEPVHTLTVDAPEEWVALVALLVAGIVTGQLAEVARRRAVEAALGERDALVLFDVVRLVNELDLDEALAGVATRLQDALGADAVLIRIDSVGSEPIRVGSGSPSALAAAQSASRDAGRLLGGPRSENGQRRRWISVRPPPAPGRRRADDYEHVRARIASEGRDLGWIVVVHQRAQARFDAADERLLLAAGSQLARATERGELQREANEAEVLRRTDELRTAMLNAVSHDLRTPLASIVAAAESLESQEIEWSDDERLEFARAIETEARRVDQMVSHLLDLSRIEAGVFRVDAQWHDIGTVIADTATRLRPSSGEHEIALSMPSHLPLLRFDAVAIGEVVTNLVENAVRHTPPGTSIAVTARATEGAVEVEVSDNGPGLSTEALEHLFEPFGRGTRGRVRTQGSGLGLAVAKGLVEAHGGVISGENDSAGGARFRFTLPASTHPPDEGPATDGAS